MITWVIRITGFLTAAAIMVKIGSWIGIAALLMMFVEISKDGEVV